MIGDILDPNRRGSRITKVTKNKMDEEVDEVGKREIIV